MRASPSQPRSASRVQRKTTARRVMGLDFASCLGLAAGCDRDGSLAARHARAGFGFLELGTLNVHPAIGDAQPLLRLCSNLADFRRTAIAGCIVGISVGSRRQALDTQAAEDCLTALQALDALADYFVVNLSRPGSAVRDGAADARELRCYLERIRRASAARLLVKVSLKEADTSSMPAAAAMAAALGYQGMIGAFEHWSSVGAAARSVSDLCRDHPDLPVVAVGGIRSATDARVYLDAGAALVQVCTLAQRDVGAASCLLDALGRPRAGCAAHPANGPGLRN